VIWISILLIIIYGDLWGYVKSAVNQKASQD